MNIHALLESKKDEKKVENLFKDLKQLEAKKDYSKLSVNQITLGLIFLNGIPELRDNPNDAYYNYYEGIGFNSKKYHRILEITTSEKIWDENLALWIYFFGEEKAKFIKEAMLFFPKMAFQQGYYRRSFRAPNQRDLHFINQLNSISNLLNALNYDFTLSEYAIYSNQMYLYNADITHLWAAAINQKDKDILPLFLDITYNRHETAKVSQSIIKAMLMSDNEEAWEAVEKLLLAAQRQEGLRQVVLECLDETSLGAMKRFIKLIIAEKLTRFSSVVRALDVWAGLEWEAQKESTIIRFLSLADKYLNLLSPENPLTLSYPDISENPILTSKDNAEIYMVLWAQGVYDVEKTYPLLDYLIENENTTPEKQLLALFFISQINLPEISIRYGLKLINSSHLPVLAKALQLLNHGDLRSFVGEKKDEIFDILKERLKDVPLKPKVFEGQVFSWLNIEISKANVFQVMINLINFENEEETDKILPFINEMDSNQRQTITYLILPNSYSETDESSKPITKKQRDFAFSIIKDRVSYIRTIAIATLAKAEISEEELPVFEEILSRKSADMRKSVIEIFLKLKPELLQISTERLLKGNIEQRLAGLDLVTQIKINKILPTEWIDKTVHGFSENPKITAQEKILVNNLLPEANTLNYNAENGFGLYNPQNITPYQEPSFPKNGEYIERTKKNTFGLSQSPQAINKALKDLEKLFLKNKNYEYTVENWNNSEETVLLGNDFRQFKYNTENFTDTEHFNNYPLAETWKKWFEDSKLSDLDLYLITLGKDIVIQMEEDAGDLEDEEENQTKKPEKLTDIFPKTFKNIAKLIFKSEIPKIGEQYWRNPLEQVLSIFHYINQYPKQIEFLEGFCQTLFASVDKSEVSKILLIKDRWGNEYCQTWRDDASFRIIFNAYASQLHNMNDAQFTTFWQLEKWKNQTTPKHSNLTIEIPSIQNYARAFGLHLITEDELLDRIMQPDFISELTTKPSKRPQYQGYVSILEQFPFLNNYTDKVRDRILDIELKRGDSATPATRLAQSLQSIFGIDVFVAILIGLGKDTLHRGYIYAWGTQAYNKREMLSTLLKKCETRIEETQKDFDEKVKIAKITEKRLVESATYAPQWLKYVAAYLDWQNMSSAVWWLHAHTNGYHSAETETEIAKYSKVEINDFKDGAVDKEWFEKAYASLGAQRWQMLYDAAKYISDGNGHTRAKLYADVILGNITLEEVSKRIQEKRNQDYLRVYGLLPLQKKNPEKDLLQRYQYLQKFKKESKQFGSQRQASESLAVRIAMDNLARTAGFNDPLRLTWAMETEEAITIIQNTKALNFDKVTVNLVVDEQGKSSIETLKEGKKLKSIPDNLKKEPAIIELKEFNTTLQNQYKRTRKSLEDMMVNGDAFTLSEIRTLMKHPVVSPMLQKLVLKSENHLGFWKENALVSAIGEVFEPKNKIEIAHCADLFADKNWSAYQQYCFEHQLTQPFKQIFRELYIPTADELKEKTISRRYAGHQVQPQKTVALLKSQGWTVNYDEGLQKVFHKEGFIAKIYAMADWFSPSDVESPTLETVEFIDQKTWKGVPFESMSQRIFSEVMRDVDLVVSVAHVGDVDPEASQSSIELRTAILRETLRLFKITNVELKGVHALIKGTKGDYSVHLGSAVVHQVAASYLSILPVHSQHRGKMFLPFLDEDPKTAEIMSKVLLLAKDNEIQDPTILRQLS